MWSLISGAARAARRDAPDPSGVSRRGWGFAEWRVSGVVHPFPLSLSVTLGGAVIVATP
jgi:hypothetical protein